MTREVLADRVRSISYIAVMPPAERERLAAEVTALVARRAGAVRPPVRVPRAVVPPTLTEPRAPPCSTWWAGAAPRPAVAPDPGPVGGARVRGDGPADAGRPGRRAVAAVPRPVPDARGARRRPRRRGRPLRGRASATTDAPATCTAAPRRSWTSTTGACPDSLDALLALPGVGPYTARAVLAFAFERDHGDRRHQHRAGARPLGRAVASDRERRRRPPTRPCHPGQAWAWNQAMLDLGASVCRRRDPACARVPGRRLLSLGVGRLPAARPRRRLRGRVGDAEPLRGQRPPGPGSAGRGPAPARGPPPPTSPRPWAGPTTRTGRHEWRRRWSPTASSATRRAPTASRRTSA